MPDEPPKGRDSTQNRAGKRPRRATGTPRIGPDEAGVTPHPAQPLKQAQRTFAMTAQTDGGALALRSGLRHT